MALQGNLEDFELTDVFQLIQLGQKDGGLRIQSEDDVGEKADLSSIPMKKHFNARLIYRYSR
jgi:hypothetical protein